MSDHGMSLVKRLNLKFPLIVAPMAGGPSSVDLVAEASRSGALGSVGAAYLNGSAIKEFVTQVRSKTANSILINLFIPSLINPVSEEQVNLAVEKTKKYRDELGLSAPKVSPPYEENFDDQFEAVLSTKPQAFSFVFGVLKNEYLTEAQKLGIYCIGTATSLEESLELEESGVDAVVAQGFEAGGHRGIFDSAAIDPEVPCLELVRQLKQKTKIPVIAAGGIMNSSQIKAALSAGAEAVQMGTAFLATKEAGTSAAYREQLLKSDHRNTKTTRVFSGRLARGIVNRFMQEMDSETDSLLPFPAQNKFTRDLRSASAARNSPDFLSLWSGSGEGRLWTGTTAELIAELFKD